MDRVFPEKWEHFRDAVPLRDRDGDLAATYSRLLHEEDQQVRDRAAAAWCAWEDTRVGLLTRSPARARGMRTRRSGAASPAS